MRLSALVIPCDGTKVRNQHDQDLADIVDTSSMSPSIGILVGADHYWSLMSGRIVQEPQLWLRRVSWVMSGPTKTEHSFFGLVGTCLLKAHMTEDMDASLKQFWELEVMGIQFTQ